MVLVLLCFTWSTSSVTIISSVRHQSGLKSRPFSLLSSIFIEELHGSAYSQCEMSWAKVFLLGQLCLEQREENEWLGVLLDWLEIGNSMSTWRGGVVFRQMSMFVHMCTWNKYMIISNNIYVFCALFLGIYFSHMVYSVHAMKEAPQQRACILTPLDMFCHKKLLVQLNTNTESCTFRIGKKQYVIYIVQLHW